MAVVLEFGDSGVRQVMEQFAEFGEFGAGEVENESGGERGWKGHLVMAKTVFKFTAKTDFRHFATTTLKG